VDASEAWKTDADIGGEITREQVWQIVPARLDFSTIDLQSFSTFVLAGF
jgi:hypothetical protein